MNIKAKLLGYDTAEISDALDACGIDGALLDIKPITPGIKLIGHAFTVKYLPYETIPKQFNNAGNYIEQVSANSVIVIDNQGRHDCTTWGDILTQVAMMRGIAGTVVNGAIRDVAFIRENKYPLYCRSVYMRTGKNRVYMAMQQCELVVNDIKIRPDDIIFGDDNGVVVIPKSHINQVLAKAKNIKASERAIINSVKSGMSLLKARQLHRYDQPWLDIMEK